MQTTKLSQLLNRMNRWQVASTATEPDKVQDLDSAIRALKRKIEVPWSLKKATMKVFRDVLIYPVAADHDHMGYMDTQLNNANNGNAYTGWDDRARFKTTSLQEFYENPDYRNRLVEIWDRGTKFLGIRFDNDMESSSLVGDKTLSQYVASGDASNLAVDNVVFVEGNSSIRFQVTLASTVATVVENFNPFSDLNYLRKYFFRWVYLTGAPTSIELRFGTDSTNYLTATVTTQFSGQAFAVNDWNLVAFNLDGATTVGVINSASFGYDAIILNDAPSGLYFLDNSYERAWTLLDYWYYSNFAVKTPAAFIADKEYFMDANDAYDLDDTLVGDTEWADVIMYDALMITFGDKENDREFLQITERRQNAWDLLLEVYPSMKPLIVTAKLNFETDYNNEANFNRN